MSDQQKKDRTIRSLGWFKDVVENLPQAKGDSFADKVVNIESARVVAAASERVMDGMGSEDTGASAEKGIAQGLQDAGRKIVSDKLTQEDPISKKVMEALGDTIGEAIKERLSGGGGLQGEEAKELAERRRADEISAIVGKINTDVIQPLKEQVQALNAKIEEKSAVTGKALTTDEAVTMVMDAQENARKLLEKQGYKIEDAKITKEEVTKMIEVEKAKQTERETELKAQWELESGQAVSIENRRIEATENILNSIVGQIMDMFLTPIKGKIEEALEKGAFGAQGA